MKPTMKLAYSFNQSVFSKSELSTLQTNLEYTEPSPGYQYDFQQILANANTYTQNSIFQYSNMDTYNKSKTFYEVKLNNFLQL